MSELYKRRQRANANCYEEPLRTLGCVNRNAVRVRASKYAELDAALDNTDKEVDVFIDDVLRGSR